LLERYKDYLIVALAIPDREDTTKYFFSCNNLMERRPHARIALALQFQSSYTDCNLAILLAIASARKWIDDREEERL
jgi:hypothetical protein